MTVHGHVRNGVIVLDTATTLPEGAAVVVSVVNTEPERSSPKDLPILKHSGTIKGLGADASRRIDKELYGAPEA
jgi:hypothetical protein